MAENNLRYKQFSLFPKLGSKWINYLTFSKNLGRSFIFNELAKRIQTEHDIEFLHNVKSMNTLKNDMKYRNLCSLLDIVNQILANKVYTVFNQDHQFTRDRPTSTQSVFNHNFNSLPKSILSDSQKYEIFILVAVSLKSIDLPIQVNDLNTSNTVFYQGEISWRLIMDIIQIPEDKLSFLLDKLTTSFKFSKQLCIYIKQACNLPVCDANGLSDPYCKLAIVNSYANYRLDSQVPLSKYIPYTSINLTSVKSQTLNPVWDEFKYFKDVNCENSLLIEVWDSDIETRKYKIGIKNLKEKIKDSLTIGRDDFIGYALLPLKYYFNASSNISNIEWVDLVNFGFKTIGKINIAIALKNILEKCEYTFHNQCNGIKLLKLFLIRSLEYVIHLNLTFIDQGLPQPLSQIADAIETFLNLNELETIRIRLPLLCNIAKSNFKRDNISLSIIVLASYAQETSSLSLIEVVYDLYCFDLNLLSNFRVHFPLNICTSKQNMKSILLSTIQLFNYLKLVNRIPQSSKLSELINEKLTVDAYDWFKIEYEKSEPFKSPILELDRATIICNVTCSAAQYLIDILTLYHEVFSYVDLSHFEIAYAELDTILSDYISQFFSTFKVEYHFSISYLENNDNQIIETTQCALIVFRFYKALSDIQSMSLKFSLKSKNLSKFHNWFKPSIVAWVGIIKSIVKVHLQRVIELDQGRIYQKNDKIKVSSSAVDISMCFEQCFQFYDLLNWPSDDYNIAFALMLAEIICDIAIEFIAFLREKAINLLEIYNNNDDCFNLDERLCILLNNTSLIYENIQEIRHRLSNVKVKDNIENSTERVNDLEILIRNTIEELRTMEFKIIVRMAKQFCIQLKENYDKFLSSSFELKFDDAIDNLMSWMVLNIQTACNHLPLEYFNTLLEEFWSSIIKVVCEYKYINWHKDIYYTRIYSSLEVFYDVFYNEGNGLDQAILWSPEWTELKKYFTLYIKSTNQLIEEYYVEIATANKHTDERFGSLTFSMAYLTNSNTLDISIIKGNNLPRMDIVGSIDPYIEIKLLPNYKNILAVTKTHKNTMHPVFNETLIIPISQKIFYNNVIIEIDLFDYDRLSTNRYVASIFLSSKDIPILYDILSDLEGLSKPRSQNFMRPFNTVNSQVLEERIYDIYAVEFSNYIKSRQPQEGKLKYTEKISQKDFKKFIEKFSINGIK